MTVRLSANIGGDDGAGGGNSGTGCSSVHNDEDDVNEDCALWDENNNNFYMIPFGTSSGYKPP
jgi:hypothetical protein